MKKKSRSDDDDETVTGFHFLPLFTRLIQINVCSRTNETAEWLWLLPCRLILEQLIQARRCSIPQAARFRDDYFNFRAHFDKQLNDAFSFIKNLLGIHTPVPVN